MKELPEYATTKQQCSLHHCPITDRDMCFACWYGRHDECLKWVNDGHCDCLHIELENEEHDRRSQQWHTSREKKRLKNELLENSPLRVISEESTDISTTVGTLPSAGAPAITQRRN